MRSDVDDRELESVFYALQVTPSKVFAFKSIFSMAGVWGGRFYRTQ
jgi:hypothetical protein